MGCAGLYDGFPADRQAISKRLFTLPHYLLINHRLDLQFKTATLSHAGGACSDYIGRKYFNSKQFSIGGGQAEHFKTKIHFKLLGSCHVEPDVKFICDLHYGRRDISADAT